MKEDCHDMARIKEAQKPSQALMPVFFRQADACVASRHYFEVNSELNPQIQRELMSISNSPGLAGGSRRFQKGLQRAAQGNREGHTHIATHRRPWQADALTLSNDKACSF